MRKFHTPVYWSYFDPPNLMPSDPTTTRIGYLLSRYPAISHTFFLKEVLGMRERGLTTEVASINLPDRPRQDLPPVEAVEADHTFYVKPSGMASVAFRVLSIALQRPAVALRGLRAALALGEFDLKARAYTLFYLAEALLVGDWMRRRSLTHLHVHFGGPVATVGMLTAKAWQIPWSLTLHGPDEFFDQEAFYLRQKIESAGFVISISDFCRSQVLRIAPMLAATRLEVVRLGVDCATLQPAVPPIKNAVFKLACTGRMVSAKGHRILIEALAALAASGTAFQCALIGDGPERPFLESECQRLGIAAQVHFLGAMAHHATLAEVAKADAFVLASFAEGLPVALMEAMALGVPCISTTIAAIPELILDRQNGILVPPRQPRSPVQSTGDPGQRPSPPPRTRSTSPRYRRSPLQPRPQPRHPRPNLLPQTPQSLIPNRFAAGHDFTARGKTLLRDPTSRPGTRARLHPSRKCRKRAIDSSRQLCDGKRSGFPHLRLNLSRSIRIR